MSQFRQLAVDTVSAWPSLVTEGEDFTARAQFFYQLGNDPGGVGNLSLKSGFPTVQLSYRYRYGILVCI